MNKKPSTPSCDSHSAKAQRITDAARRLFAANGFAATSMDAIVDEAQVSKSTIYNHYPSKEALFGATVHQETARIASEMTIAAGDENQPIEDALYGLAQSYIVEILANERLDFHRLIVSESPRFPELGRIFYDNVVQHGWRALSTLIERANQRHQLAAEDSELAADQLLAMLRGNLHLRALVGLPVDQPMIDRTCDEAVRTFLARFRP